MLNRKGATKAILVPEDVLNELNKGNIETVNLVEWLEVNHEYLLTNVLDSINRTSYIEPTINALNQLKKKTAAQSIACVGQMLLILSKEFNDTKLFPLLSNHGSDSVRCWSTYMIGSDSTLTIDQKLDNIKFLAADTHFGVREIVWMAVRADIIDNLDKSISILSSWVKDEDPNVRRFATESTRPRGVWCKHIETLKLEPWLALPILEPLKSDPSKYVQDSVANWLNDASKTQPDWVRTTCDQWLRESNTTETNKIVKRALRSLQKD